MRSLAQYIIPLVLLLVALLALESIAQAASFDAHGSFKHNLYVILAGKFGTFLMVLLGASGALCLMLSGGQSSRSNQLIGYGVALLVLAALLVGVRLLVATGTMEYIEIRESYRPN